MHFVPMWRALEPAIAARAQAAGIPGIESGAELQPRASALTFAGTRWSGLRSGALRFDVVEHRRDLRCNCILEVGATVQSVPCAFGVFGPTVEGTALWPQAALQEAVGLWLTSGSLSFRRWSDGSRVVPAEALVEFDLWRALDAMARLARGEASFGHASKEADPANGPSTYSPPSWAPQCETSLAQQESGAFAQFNSPRMHVSGSVTLMMNPVDPSAAAGPHQPRVSSGSFRNGLAFRGERVPGATRHRARVVTAPRRAPVASGLKRVPPPCAQPNAGRLSTVVWERTASRLGNRRPRGGS